MMANFIEELNGKTLGNTRFIEKDGELFGRVCDSGVVCDYAVRDVRIKKPVKAVLTDLDGTTLTSEQFWIYIIEETVKRLLGDGKFSLTESDIPFVSGYTTNEHLGYCIKKYAPDKKLSDANAIYHEIAKRELDLVLKGEGRTDAFEPAEGLKEFLLTLKDRKIKIGLATSGLDYKAVPEITAVFNRLGLGDPLAFYDSIITGGRRKDVGQYGTLGEIAAKPHPWIYTELAYTGLRVNEETSVVGVEDSAAGLLSLRFAGFSAIGINGGNIKQSGLDCLCSAKVNALTDILALI